MAGVAELIRVSASAWQLPDMGIVSESSCIHTRVKLQIINYYKLINYPTWEIHRVRVTDTLKYTCVCLFSKYTANTQFQISSKYTPNTLNTLCFQSISKYTKYTSPM